MARRFLGVIQSHQDDLLTSFIYLTQIESEEALNTARLTLIDTIGCGLEG